MELHFLGTASCFPTPDRGVSCTALQKDGIVWLFDCGEGSQIQLQKSKVKPGKIRKIFITHLHGDHLFGLPGLLCTIGQNAQLSDPLEIYGPKGLRLFLRQSLMLSYSLLSYKYVVHELILDIEGDTEDNFQADIAQPSKPSVILHPDEILGENIDLSTTSDQLICEGNSCFIYAAPILHRVPCVGYVIKESNLPGKLDVDKLKSIGINPGPICARLKNGESVSLPDGRIIIPEDVIGMSRPGRKIVILGDTQDSQQISHHAMDADVIVHEATHEDSMKDKAIEHGHSTAGMAGLFATEINAKTLILTHFSQRYRKEKSTTSKDKTHEETTEKLVKEAKNVFNGDVLAAFDFFSFSIDLPK